MLAGDGLRGNHRGALDKTGSEPVEPPAPTVSWSTGATLGSSVIVPVHRGELDTRVSREAVTGVTRVTSHPDTVIRLLAVHSGGNM